MTETPKRAAIYARSATQQQAHAENHAVVEQIARCRAYCTEHGYSIGERHIYQDLASGAVYQDRQQLNGLLAAVREHQIDIVVIYDADRLSRNPVHLVTIIEELAQHNVKVEIVREPFALVQLLGNALRFVEQMEREKKVDRMRRGRRRAKQQRELQ